MQVLMAGGAWAVSVVELCWWQLCSRLPTRGTAVGDVSRADFPPVLQKALSVAHRHFLAPAGLGGGCGLVRAVLGRAGRVGSAAGSADGGRGHMYPRGPGECLCDTAQLQTTLSG